jgi:hypothetical protein
MAPGFKSATSFRFSPPGLTNRPLRVRTDSRDGCTSSRCSECQPESGLLRLIPDGRFLIMTPDDQHVADVTDVDRELAAIATSPALAVLNKGLDAFAAASVRSGNVYNPPQCCQARGWGRTRLSDPSVPEGWAKSIGRPIRSSDVPSPSRSGSNSAPANPFF